MRWCAAKGRSTACEATPKTVDLRDHDPDTEAAAAAFGSPPCPCARVRDNLVSIASSVGAAPSDIVSVVAAFQMLDGGDTRPRALARQANRLRQMLSGMPVGDEWRSGWTAPDLCGQVDKAVNWWAIDPDTAVRWAAVNVFDPEEASRWVSLLGVDAPPGVVGWQLALGVSVSAVEAQQWVDAGFGDPRAVEVWMDRGVRTPQAARACQRQDLMSVGFLRTVTGALITGVVLLPVLLIVAAASDGTSGWLWVVWIAPVVVYLLGMGLTVRDAHRRFPTLDHKGTLR